MIYRSNFFPASQTPSGGRMSSALEIKNELILLREEITSLNAKVDRLLDAPTPKSNSSTELSYNGKEIRTITLDVSALDVGLDQKKQKAFKLKGHPFTKFGVPLYPDSTLYKEIEIDPEMDFGEYDCSHRIVVQMGEPNDEGKSFPLRALRLAD